MINCEPQICNFESVDEDSFDSDCEEDSDNEIEIVDNDSMILNKKLIYWIMKAVNNHMIRILHLL